MIRCQACGTLNPPGSSFCSKCARKLDEDTQRAVAVKRASHTATGIRWSAVILTAIIIIVLVVLIAFAVLHGL